MKLNLTPRLECVLCGPGPECTPTDEYGLGEPTFGLCAGCGVGMDHGREFVRFWRLGFRDWNKDKVGRHRGRDVPEHLAHAYDVGWAAAEAAANARNWESSPYWQRRGWCYGAGLLPLNGKGIPTKAIESHTAAFRAGRDALSKGTDKVRRVLWLPKQKHLTEDDLPGGPDQEAISAYQRAVHGEDY